MHIKDAVDLTDALIKAFEKKTEGSVSFGEWILNNSKMSVEKGFQPKYRDFAGARRTSDARTYLVGFLITGSITKEEVENLL